MGAIAQGKVDPGLRRWIHVPLTSYDALDTARALQFVRGHEAVRRLTDKVIGLIVEQVNSFALRPQIGRTHGQHALPITVGFWFATILSRILTNIQSANSAAEKLVGKISGAVGVYNAQVGLGIAARSGDKSFEERVLEKLGLKAAPISTQVLPPEPLADYLFSCVKLSAAFGQFGRDGRHLMRTEIAELGEPFEKGQVGSSTMAHKRNPINFENLEGTWIKNQVEFGKVLATMISEHQRDLVGSSIARDFPTIVVNLVNQLNTLLREADGKPFISRISVDEASLKRNFNAQGDAILAEPIYIALQMAGYEGDAHELVNHVAMPRSIQGGSFASRSDAVGASAAVGRPSMEQNPAGDDRHAEQAGDLYGRRCSEGARNRQERRGLPQGVGGPDGPAISLPPAWRWRVLRR